MAPKSSLLVSLMVVAYIAYGVKATQCPPNQVFQDCGGCERTCANLEDLITCPPICRPGCYCVSGTVRNAQHQCVHPDDCPDRNCPSNEVFLDCAGCELACTMLSEEPVPCPPECRPPRCQCVGGTARNELGYCVPFHQC